MKYDVRVWILEAKELRNTDWTCVPRVLPPDAEKGDYMWFDSEDSFLATVRAAFAGMFQANDSVRNLLVISAHGREKTGTYLQMARNIAMSTHGKADAFSIRPKGLIILVSACWGGYPSVREMLRGGSDTEHAFVVAPLVAIDATHVNAVQAEIVAAMVEEDDVDTAIEAIVRKHDNHLWPTYDEVVLRFIRRDGTMEPPESKGGLAAVMEKPASFRVIALQKLPTQRNEPPGIAIIQAVDREFWRISTSSLCSADPSQDDVYGMLGQVVTLRAKKAVYSESAELGDLVDTILLPNPPKVKAPPVLPPPNPHCGEQTTVKKDSDARQIRVVALLTRGAVELRQVHVGKYTAERIVTKNPGR